MSLSQQQYILSVLVQDESGMLNRIATMFSRRGFNIESLSVGNSEQPDLSRMTIVVNANEDEIEQLQKQLNKLIGVVNIQLLTNTSFVAREMILVQVKMLPEQRIEIAQIVELFRARIIDVASNSMIIEITGSPDKLQAFIDLLDKYGIMAISRAGQIALSRGGID